MMNDRMTILLLVWSVLVSAGFAQPVSFTKLRLADHYYADGINYGDFNKDGKRDIVAGPYWYAGPTFKAKHAIYEPVALKPEASPSNSMFSFVHDFDGDGWDDVLVLGRVHKHAAYWYQNPQGKTGHWQKHYVFERVRGESPTLTDINVDGKPDLICHWEGRWGWLSPGSDPTKAWAFRSISHPGPYNQFYHGTGVGDVNGDGRSDLIINEGWWEQPETDQPVWRFHRYQFSDARGGAQMFAYDVDEDGDNDIISSLDGHGWGLAWFEQIDRDGKIDFRKHMVMGDRSEESTYGVAFSQVHALDLKDIDGDGRKDIVTGKRRWAHGPKGDAEPNADPVVYWFRLTESATGVRFVPHRIDAASGTGVQITAIDIDANDSTDVLTVSKLGTFVFLNNAIPRR